MTLTLLSDVLSGKFDKTGQILYARKGDMVTLIADHDDVLIVEKDGNRFPVAKLKTNIP